MWMYVIFKLSGMSSKICVTFAVSDEYHQTFVSERTGRPLDVAIDSAGSIAGVAFCSTYYLIYRYGYKNGLEQSKKIKGERLC